MDKHLINEILSKSDDELLEIYHFIYNAVKERRQRQNHTTMREFQIGDRVIIKNPSLLRGKGRELKGKVGKIIKKGRSKIHVSFPGFSGEWHVSPGVLTKVNNYDQS